MNKFDIAILADTHYGARNSSDAILNNQKKFFEEHFFPILEENNIKTIIHLGDLFDRRKNIDYRALEKCKKDFLNILESKNIQMFLILGNHDTYYKSSNKLNSPELLLSEYKNITIIQDEPYEYENCLMVPWINSENHDVCIKSIQNSECKYLMGHFEINGADMGNGRICDFGLNSELFSKFFRVFSGHFHKRQDMYVGSHCQFTWSDYDQERGFELFNTKTGNSEYIENKNYLFHKIEYTDDLEFDFSEIENCYVKVLKPLKIKKQKYDKFLENLENANPFDVKIIEEIEHISSEDVIIDESKDTLEIIRETIQNSEFEKSEKVMGIIENLYKESVNMEK